MARIKRALADGGGLRLVIPANTQVLRIFKVIGLDRFIPRFATLEQALPQDPLPPIERVTPEPNIQVRDGNRTGHER